MTILKLKSTSIWNRCTDRDDSFVLKKGYQNVSKMHVTIYLFPITYGETSSKSWSTLLLLTIITKSANDRAVSTACGFAPSFATSYSGRPDIRPSPPTAGIRHLSTSYERTLCTKLSRYVFSFLCSILKFAILSAFPTRKKIMKKYSFFMIQQETKKCHVQLVCHSSQVSCFLYAGLAYRAHFIFDNTFWQLRTGGNRQVDNFFYIQK